MSKLYAFAHIHWRYNDNWNEKNTSVPIKVFKLKHKANRYCQGLEEKAIEGVEIEVRFPDDKKDKTFYYEVIAVDFDGFRDD